MRNQKLLDVFQEQVQNNGGILRQFQEQVDRNQGILTKFIAELIVVMQVPPPTPSDSQPTEPAMKRKKV
jgi:hypothetical protein